MTASASDSDSDSDSASADGLPRLADPMDAFRRWIDAARSRSDVDEPEAMSLATCDSAGRPNVRMVLLKGLDRGFVFYTDSRSVKGEELMCRPRPVAALCWLWKPMARQVRARGRVEPVSRSEADEYFASRPRLSRLGAWASRQSRVAAGRAEIDAALAEVERRFADTEDIPRPPHWNGYRVIPSEVEFWIGRDGRLHDRVRYSRDADDDSDSWTRQRLFP